MGAMIKILKPILWIAFIVGTLRFALSITHAPRMLVYAASLTVVELAGLVYLAVRVGRHQTLNTLHLWGGTLILFGFCQALYLTGIAYTAWSGIPTLYHETSRLTPFLGYEPSLGYHAWLHVQNWMVIVPTLGSWIIGAPIVALLKRRQSSLRNKFRDH